uniref:Uncharacterized protein n=1 Tax=Anguilla anguilla TaxID=7936 RepID=A0A0E9SB45_ANGAN
MLEFQIFIQRVKDRSGSGVDALNQCASYSALLASLKCPEERTTMRIRINAGSPKSPSERICRCACKFTAVRKHRP